MSKHKPDHELQLMQRVLRDLAKLRPAGRRRVVAYWAARIEQMPEQPDLVGEQQLDIADVLVTLRQQVERVSAGGDNA